ncbi:hypothetical protein C5N14_02900 [Micromonospora sp. MW-13]|nr:hypothetical protein C5N14_02900 [Micromonospora sp. MW-13]
MKDGAPPIITTGDSFAGGRLTDARALTDGTCQFRFSGPGSAAGSMPWNGTYGAEPHTS